jgi:hypothetical protein
MWLVKQGGSSNPKGGAEQEETGKEGNQDWRFSGRRGLERPPIGREFGSRHIRIGCLRINILSVRRRTQSFDRRPEASAGIRLAKSSECEHTRAPSPLTIRWGRGATTAEFPDDHQVTGPKK